MAVTGQRCSLTCFGQEPTRKLAAKRASNMPLRSRPAYSLTFAGIWIVHPVTLVDQQEYFEYSVDCARPQG